MSQLEPFISVVVPSYNGEKTLPILLKSLELQTFKEFEVIVVIDGSTDNSRTLKANKWNLDIHWVEQENIGRSGARNSGAHKANTKYLLFFDDDVIPEKDVVAGHIIHHQNISNSVKVGYVSTTQLSEVGDYQRFRRYLSEKWIKELMVTPLNPLPNSNPILTAAHFSLEKDLFQNIGGFDTSLNDCEDFDLAIRLRKNNVPIYFDKSLNVEHVDHLSLKAYIGRLREYKKSYSEVERKYGSELIEERYQDYHKLSLLKRWIYRSICRSSTLSVMENTPIWVRIIPEKLRFRLYDIAITGYTVHFPDLVLE